MIKKIDFIIETLKTRDMTLAECEQVLQLKTIDNYAVLNTLQTKKLLKISVNVNGQVTIKKR